MFIDFNQNEYRTWICKRNRRQKEKKDADIWHAKYLILSFCKKHCVE